MRRHIAKLAILVATLTPWAEVAACTCGGRPSLTELYKDSSRVFLGEVVQIQVLTKDPVEGQDVTYVATVRPLETFKGSSVANVRVTFTRKYAAPVNVPLQDPAVVDPAFQERTLTIVSSGCSFGMSEGKYYIFEKHGEPLSYAGWCSQRVVYESIIILEFMRGLRDAG